VRRPRGCAGDCACYPADTIAIGALVLGAAALGGVGGAVVGGVVANDASPAPE
jgi:hypothetical protein